MSDKMLEALKLADAALSGAKMNMDVVWKKVKEALAQQPAAVVELTEGMALVPTRLTAENGAKSALSGEFNVAVETDCDDCDDCELEEICQTCLGEGYTVRYEPVSWTMIKDIWAAGIAHFAKQGGAA